MNYPLLYREHLSQRDFELLAQTAGTDDAALKQRMLERPEAIDELLASRRLFEMIFDPSRELADPGASSFLSFAALVNRSASDLHDAPTSPSGPARASVSRSSMSTVFASFSMMELVRFFLIEFLNSFTTVASGTFRGAERQGLRQRRFSELDPVALAEMVELLPLPSGPGAIGGWVTSHCS